MWSFKRMFANEWFRSEQNDRQQHDSAREQKIIQIRTQPFDVSDRTFEREVLQKRWPMMVYFWAHWCGPCRAIYPAIEELSEEYRYKLEVARIDVDDNAKTPKRYRLESIPTLIFFKSGNVAEMIVGAVSKSQIRAAIDQVVA